MEHLPFCVFKRTGREFYYVKFKNEIGKYDPAVSTKQETKAAAIATAYDWLKNGKPMADGEIIAIPVMEAAKRIQTTAEADFVCGELKRKGLLKDFIIAESEQDVDFPSFLRTFWDFDDSPYVKEKLRKNHGIHKNYTVGQRLIIEKYWAPFFKGRLLGGIVRQDIERFVDDVSERKLSAARKNTILKAGTIPLRWAFSKEILRKDATRGVIWFSGKAKERQILTPEVAGAVFRVEWKDERARLANMLAAVTGLRSGEIQGLQVQDLRVDCINVRHSWNGRDGLKTTKNNETRTVEVPFPDIIHDLLAVAGKNPHGAMMDSFVFWSKALSSSPMQKAAFVNGLRDALVKTGVSREAAKVYVFHGWRHFYTSYMRERLDAKLLQSQTGHKTMDMLEHYSGHKLAGDREKIRRAGLEAFGALMPLSQSKNLS
jgi:integrase